MRTVNFRDVIVWPIVSRQGYDPTKDLFSDYADALSRYINSWVRKCWDAADWPELSRLETRVPTNHLVPYDVAVYAPANWLVTTGYNLDSVVRDPAATSDTYISLQNANTGHALTDGAWWAKVNVWDNTQSYTAGTKVVDPTSGIVYIAQANITPGTVLSDSLQNTKAWSPLYSQKQPTEQISDIGKVLKVYPVDPRTSDGPFDIPFRLYDTAIHVGYDHGTKVWIKFMSRASVYTLTVWDLTITYSSGDLAYDPVSGNCYRSLQSNNTNHAVTNPSWWSLVPFPYVIAEPVWRGAYSDALRDEGLHAKAAAEEQAAMNELQLAISRNLTTRFDQLTDQQTGVPRTQSQPVSGAA